MPVPQGGRCRRCRSRIPDGVFWCTLCHSPLVVPEDGTPEQRDPSAGHGEPEQGERPAALGEAPAPSLVGGEVSDQMLAELVAELAVGECEDRGLPWLRNGAPPVATRVAAAAAGIGVVLVLLLVAFWVVGLLL